MIQPCEDEDTEECKKKLRTNAPVGREDVDNCGNCSTMCVVSILMPQM